MNKWPRTIGLIFASAMSVYADRAILSNSASAADISNSTPATNPSSTSGVKLLDDATDPFANSNPAAPAPTTQASDSTSPTSSTTGTAGDVNVADNGTVEIHVNDANIVEVLRMLSLQSQKNIITSNQVSGKVTANLYGVTVHEALDAILHANGYAYREKGNFIYVYSSKEVADLEKAERQPTTEVFRLFYTPAANAVTMIKPVLSADAQVSSTTAAVTGLPTGAGDSGGDTHATEDMVVVTDYPDNLEKVRKLIAEIDRRPQQILIEATILRASLSENNALGVDFQVLGGVDFSTVTSAAGQITGAAIDPATTAGGGKTLTSAGTGNTFSSSVPNGLKVGIVSNQLSVFLSALESVTDTTILANPKVLALNKQKGEVIVGRQDGYLTTTVTENAQTQTVEFLDTGTRLVFRPFIGDDGYIRMEIHPEDSSGGLTGDNLPFKITTEVTTNVLVKDNHTIVIGGLFRESNNTARSQIPGLGNLPLVGAAFRQQADTTSRDEVIVLLTPHIIKDDDVYSLQSEKEMRDAEKLRVGVRRDMMPWGRERLAEGCYDQAVNEMNKDHPDKARAIWYLNCATDLNPTFQEAIELKQDISGKEITTVDNSSLYHFVSKAMLADIGSAQKLPSVVPIDPSTQPSSEPTVDLLNPPTTVPTVASAATTSPTTQPAVAPIAIAVPTTTPTIAAAEPTTRPAIAAAVPPPATQPAAALQKSAITNVSTEEDEPEGGE